MATSLKTIPNDASTLTKREGFINAPGEANHGHRASFEVKQAYCAGELTQWLIIRVAGQKFSWADRSYWCKRATGRNIAKLQAQIPELTALISEAEPCNS